MKTEEIIDRLRHPHKYRTKSADASKASTGKQQASNNSSQLLSWIAPALFACVLVIIFVTWLFVLHAKNKADNLTEALEPSQVEGLMYDAEFNPSKDVTYVQITEGSDRNVSVDTLGTTLPIISRYNYQAITPNNYKIIGMAPWALTENFAANLQDPELIQYLLNRPEVGEAFVAHADVAPLLEDPKLLTALAQDETTLNEFFSSQTIAQMLEDEKMVRAIAGSRFMSYLLISKAVKFYRDNPQQAVKLINASPTLRTLRRNPGIRQAVEENRYLKPIAKQLLGNTSAPSATQK